MNNAVIKLRMRPKARVEIIPLIDVVFFLLATFVLFTLSLNRTQAIPVPLPYGDHPDRKPPKLEPVQLKLSDGGRLYWNDDPIDVSELPARIAHYKSVEPSPKILVSGDDRVSFGATVDVLDQLRLANITDYSVDTRVRSAAR